MSDYKITNVIIAITLVALIVAVFTLFMTDQASKYGLDMNNQTLENYDQLQEMKTQAESIKNNESDMKTRGGLSDILGDWFEQGHTTLRASSVAIDTVNDLSESSTENLNLGQTGALFKVAIGIIILIIVIIGIFISTLTKREQ